MGNFDNIIQEINTNLPDNNVQEITAKRLRDTLYDLVDTLDVVTTGIIAERLELNETSGKYINDVGGVSTAADYAYTEQFYVEKGTTIVVKARGYQTNVAMISKVITQGVLYTPIVISTDSQIREYKYVVEESGFYAASFNRISDRRISIIAGTSQDLQDQITELDNKVDINIDHLQRQIDTLDGKVDTNTNNLQDQIDTLDDKVDTIDSKIDDAQYNIGQLNEKIDNTKDTLQAEIDLLDQKLLNDYDYLQNEIRDLEQQQDEQNELIDELEVITHTIKVQDKSYLSRYTGEYIGSDGVRHFSTACKRTQTFYAEPGETIVVKVKGYPQMAVIAREVLTMESYEPYVVSVDSSIDRYSYIVQNPGYYTISYDASYEPEILVTSSPRDIYNFLKAAADDHPIDGSTNLITSGAVYDAVSTKQDTLVSGTNIKTINNQSLLGEGNITISGGSGSYIAGNHIQISEDNVIGTVGLVDNLDFLAHTTNLNIHVTSEDKANWNNKLDEVRAGNGIEVSDGNIVNVVGKADALDLIAHETNLGIHVTTEDKTNWNAKADATRLGGMSLVKITQAAYDALTTKDSNTLYIIVG